MTRMGIEPFERFPGVEQGYGAVGALMSHLNLLKEAREKKVKNVLIFEDDFEFLISKEELWKLLDSVKDMEYDVIMMGANRNSLDVADFNENLFKVTFAMAPSAYLVNSPFFDILIKTFEDALPLLIEKDNVELYAVDTCWRDLQPKSKWYLFKTKVGKQRASYSNIVHNSVNYQTGGNGAIGAVRYINLGHRKDRKKEIEHELSRMGFSSFERFPAVNHKKKAVGCMISHLDLLKEAKEKGYPNILILEDDFEFLVSKEEFWDTLAAIKDLDYDVVMLAYQVMEHEPYNETLLKVISAQCAAGYIVNARFYDTLIQNMEEALPKFIETGEHWNYANDQCWKTLQPKSKWYAFKTHLGKVRASYSDIQGKTTNHYISKVMGGSRKSKKTRRRMRKHSRLSKRR